MQNFACRIVSVARKYDHITPIRKELNWLSVANQLYYRSATMAFKCMTGHAPEYLSSKFLKRAEVSSRSTRNSQLLNIPLFKTASGQRTVYYRIVNLWNSLDYSHTDTVISDRFAYVSDKMASETAIRPIARSVFV